MQMKDVALSLLTNGYTPLRLEPSEKYTKATGWSTTTPTEESIHRDFSRPSNIGVRLGDASKDGTYLIAIDIDVEDAPLIRCVERAIGTSVPVKRGKKGYTYFVRMDREVKTHKIYLKRDGKKTAAIDILAKGAQTVIPPSIHPDTKKPYQWVAGTPITHVAVNEIPIFSPSLLDEIRGFGANEEDFIYALNDMEWRGAGGGGNTHDTCVSAVSSMVARKWTDAEIQYRIQRAKQEACEASGLPYNWPEAERTIQEWIDSSRDKKFDTTSKQRKDDIPVEMLNNYVYVVEIDRMYDLKKNVALNKTQFDNVHWRDLPKPWVTLLCSPDLRICDKLTYSPGQPQFCMEKSFHSPATLDCLNTWTANDIEPEEGDVSIWLDLVSKVFDDDEKAINHVISFLAFAVQYPGQRINHAIVLQGTQGIGKDSIFNAVAAIFGSQNVASVTLNQVESQFNDWLFGKQLIIFQEMLAPGRRSIYNKLKTVITDETHSVNMKHLPVQRIYNRGNYIFLTNYKHALSLDRDDRRMWVWYSRMQPQHESYYVNFYKWMSDKRSIAHLYDFLLKYDTSAFNPTASPYMTVDKMHMIRSSSSEVEQYLRDAYENHTWPLASDLINTNHILSALRPIMRVSAPLLSESLEHICGELGECSVRPRIKSDGGADVRLRLKSIRRHNKWKNATAAELLAEYKVPLPPLQGESDGSYSKYDSGGAEMPDTGDDF